ncbi:tRNA epoxyqueuosine(34) reductase QueG [Alienimonas chondri]|uniref:Epoxyqueuosine reductase n=1 Tax=Alienimonas chondri TaxID=2681879 RepID=A0ABX1VD93_9PLAN|nr:tRNA epoxyqueuosine(34) reductase QueG [Alienimonas chondri]NNJ25931.1 Epoxyqueuosine reductase [Alienimonas chondri]
MSPVALTAALKERSAELGFTLCGVAPAARPDTLDALTDWLAAGFHGEMGYMERRRDAYAHPDGVLPGVRSVVMLATSYHTADPPDAVDPPPGFGKVARYARGGVDYHDLLRQRMKPLAALLHEHNPGGRTRTVVDTAPLLERDFARRAGLGWFGKNTLLLNKRAGSYLLLSAILTDALLDYDPPHESAHCGTCTACLDACPTDAFIAPHVLDARRCISYLTIEAKEPIPDDLKDGCGDWLFGCDICQEVCPWNRKPARTTDPAFAPRPDLAPASAAAIVAMSDADLHAAFDGTPLDRPGPDGLRRNAENVLRNTGVNDSGLTPSPTPPPETSGSTPAALD